MMGKCKSRQYVIYKKNVRCSAREQEPMKSLGVGKVQAPSLPFLPAFESSLLLSKFRFLDCAKRLVPDSSRE